LNKARANGIRNSKKAAGYEVTQSAEHAHGYVATWAFGRRAVLVDVMKRWILGISFLLLWLPMLAQNTNVTATIIDSTGQVWANGSYSITFVPNPQQPGQYYWEGVPFSPQKYTGGMNGSGAMTVTLPDNGTITPAGSSWAFVLCANTSAPCSTVTTPVTGPTQDFSAQFSSMVVPPQVYATPLVRSYSNAEVSAPPLNQGGQYYNVTQNVPYFWTGTQWISLGGTVSNVSAGNLPPLFTTTVTTPGTTPQVNFFLSNAPARYVFANCTGTTTVPSYCQLNSAMIALAGTLSNDTTGAAGNVIGGYVASISSTSTPLTIAPTTGNSVATLQVTGTEGKVVTAAGAATSGYFAQWDSSGGLTGVAGQLVPSTQKTEINTVTSCGYPDDGANEACTNTVTLGTAMADTGYTVSCVEYTNPAMGTVVLSNVGVPTIISTTQYSFQVRTQGSSTEWPTYPNYGKSFVCTAYHP
jgi:hypothetical protein